MKFVPILMGFFCMAILMGLAYGLSFIESIPNNAQTGIWVLTGALSGIIIVICLIMSREFADEDWDRR